MRVMGIDIEPGQSPSSSRTPSYSIVVVNDKGEIEYKAEAVPLTRILRLAWELRPGKLAVDNIYELAAEEKKLVKILSLFPDRLEVVQVTYVNGTFKDIRDVAREAGIEVQGKPTPIKTAYLAAVLALKGIGTPIKIKENKTKIIISRGRAIGPGGMSSNRYKRNLRGLILRVAKRIKEELDSHGFDYDYSIKRSKAGIERAVFTVYSPRESLYGIVRKMKGHDLRVEIKPVYKSKIEFGDAKKEAKPLIVGIDPGIEVGISIIDLHGNPLLLISRRNIDREDIIDIVRKHGKPILIATDVTPVPDTVKKIASTLNSKLFVPDRRLGMDEKMLMVDKYSTQYGIKIDDPHVRDSLAAALKAYYEISHKLNHARGLLRRMDIEVDEDKVLECVIGGKTINECIEKEIEKEIEDNESERQPQFSAVSHNTDNNNQIESLQEENIQLKREIDKLRRKIRDLAFQNTLLQKRIDEIKMMYNKELQKERKIYELKLEIENYIKSLNSLKEQLENEKIENKELLSIIEGLAASKLTVVKVSDLPSYLQINTSEKKIILLGEEVNNSLVKLFLADSIIIERDLIKDIETLYREKIIAESENLDLRRLLDDYRRSRFRTK
ncbi:DUF460 domain-containing protein [Stygiolobus caldivivus]|uniref:DUF460 domain-containing protein n=1 Tax=Stygiolobus caldivivus TaxID=2824673 RepID=A0A8D5U6V1_9CREN|nr:DUF460 domain-containing protein [Stygiolobus caldivivus]BCU70399.1 hypothetical protein KN1_16960 [Stygiolobus caldivivus]